MLLLIIIKFFCYVHFISMGIAFVRTIS